ncbi:MAG: DUF2934 domain-containing protein [Candidatus Rokubacteria bacterium]|nr:DUF2934 domain-containing protein [Candidatus Rokubacteria bacterium]
MAKSTRATKKRPPRETPSNGGADRDAIARRAYELFQARGGQHGYEIEDWLQAERELRTGRQDQR